MHLFVYYTIYAVFMFNDKFKYNNDKTKYFVENKLL